LYKKLYVKLYRSENFKLTIYVKPTLNLTHVKIRDKILFIIFVPCYKKDKKISITDL